MKILITVFIYWLAALIYFAVAAMILDKLENTRENSILHKIVAMTWIVSIPLAVLVAPICIAVHFIFRK